MEPPITTPAIARAAAMVFIVEFPPSAPRLNPGGAVVETMLYSSRAARARALQILTIVHGTASAATMALRPLFATPIYEATLSTHAQFENFNAELEAACRMLAKDDQAGRAWSKAHGYGGYTSYASLN